ncbi:nucleoside-diphosphate kinase [candidate division KSB1 bacterium]|nr:nucleoside-diphosphate kinase [candidate division KSB1 bacterium]MCH8287413.1 nucleoside-diphosphate kinase [candidate division KSB1 bacterium]
MARTLGILKPDCIRRKLMGTVIKRLEEEGFTIIDVRFTQLSVEKAERFYAIHKERPFFGDLIEFMTSGPVFVMHLEHENAVRHLRDVIGATDPAEADPGTIRGQLAESKQNNLVHASDSDENANIEIHYFFQ